MQHSKFGADGAVALRLLNNKTCELGTYIKLNT